MRAASISKVAVQVEGISRLAGLLQQIAVERSGTSISPAQVCATLSSHISKQAFSIFNLCTGTMSTSSIDYGYQIHWVPCAI